MRRRRRASTHRLRAAVSALPRHTREAMLRGIAANRIVVGAYVDPHSGGICPMLAAHRNGGRTSVASFARAWDAFTGASRPRLATRREVGILRSMLEQSLDLDPELDQTPISVLAAQIRAEREQLAGCRTPAAKATGEPEAAPDAPSSAEEAEEPPPAAIADDESDVRRRPEPYLDLLAVAEAALADEGRWERVGEAERAAR